MKFCTSWPEQPTPISIYYILYICQTSALLTMTGASSEMVPFDAALSGAAMDTGDVFEIFVEVMQNKMSNRSLGFNFTFEAYKAKECRVIRLTKTILAKVRIGQLDDIRFVRLCAGGNVFGISILRPASIRFFTSGDVEVWSIEGDGPTLRRELGLSIECVGCV
jgi:hypothetical protein